MVRVVVVMTAGTLVLAGCGTLFDDGKDGMPAGAAAGRAAGDLALPGRDAGAAAAALILAPGDHTFGAADAAKKAREASRATKRPPILVPSDRVRAMQLNLKSLGYDPGPADGLMGPRTRAALKRYQEDRGLTADGKPTQLVMERVAGEAEQGSRMSGIGDGDACSDEVRRRAGFLRAALRWILAEKSAEACGAP